MATLFTMYSSGLVHLLQLLGGLTLAVIAIVVTEPVVVALLVVVVPRLLVAALATILPEKMIDVSATGIGTTTVTAATPETALAAQTLGTRCLRFPSRTCLSSS